MEQTTFRREIAGRELIVEFSNLAEQANGSVIVRYGQTTVLATAVLSKTAREGVDYLPLLVEYEERFYAAGKIFGSRFIRRESRPSEEATLTGRLIDRAIRPRFDQRMRQEVQVIITVLSIDDENDPDVPALIGASLALATSDIPWQGPVAGVRVGGGAAGFTQNPTFKEREEGTLDLFVAGTKERINMMEAGAKELPEAEMIQAIGVGFAAIKELIDFQEEILAKQARPKAKVLLAEPDPELKARFEQMMKDRLEQTLDASTKTELTAKLSALKEELVDALGEDKRTETEGLFESAVNDAVHRNIVEQGKRPDGRAAGELRELNATVGLISRTHGSGLFMRGQTHALSILTLGTPSDQQLIEGIEIRGKKRFLHHYNFPPYSVGEIKPMRGPGRREIGHGALAERALKPLIPNADTFPYTIRIVSEILSSNGSSSMASVCGSSLALMDAGVPVAKHVAGVAMGLMMRDADTYVVLTDIQGPEDHHGDMDFKVAGTADGITAVQMDVKIEGVTLPMVEETFAQARAARMQILEVMASCIRSPRAELSPYAPRIITLKINPDKIREVIGPGGKMINAIIADTGATIDIEDDGTVFIGSTSEESAQKAVQWINNITREVKVGEIYEGKVTRLMDFGAIVEILPGQDGLVHISELAPWRVERVDDIVRVGDTVPVKVKELGPNGKISLSLKAARYPDAPDSQPDRPPRPDRPRHPEGRDRRPAGRTPRFR
ncbi:polyribonucleotide nucleotidyltransferase [Candidatus Parcubacteria bacterium]|nr:polyribonucleotide nucleotidyltransferase [Candidatus Parcubacteria bacterium]